MTDHTPTTPMAEPQRITVGCDMVPGPQAEAVAERILSIVIDELRRSGIVITAISVKMQGCITAW
ncbi:MAG: hypothetical protein ACRD0H_04775 [Actinomycetes bacterium]